MPPLWMRTEALEGSAPSPLQSRAASAPNGPNGVGQALLKKPNTRPRNRQRLLRIAPSKTETAPSFSSNRVSPRTSHQSRPWSERDNYSNYVPSPYCVSPTSKNTLKEHFLHDLSPSLFCSIDPSRKRTYSLLARMRHWMKGTGGCLTMAAGDKCCPCLTSYSAASQPPSFSTASVVVW